MRPTSVGIDAMAFHGPECYVDMEDLAEARGVAPAKFTQGIGQRQMAVVTPCEDTVTMAAQAGRRALQAFDIDPDEIGTLIVGTETGVDHSKPVAVYVHELLGLPTSCRTFETKHACYGAMAGLTSAADWIQAGRARGRKALIIASDIARYGLGTPGEPTQGAGAVAMVVSPDPRLITFDPEIEGDYTRQVMDFWRPLYSKYAFADGHYSIDCYLDALESCWHDAVGKAGGSHEAFALSVLDACFYHVPFTRMAKKAHHRHWETELGRAIERDSEDGARVEDSYRQRVEPWLSLNADVGNIYTGSLFLCLIDYLRQATSEREGRPISLFSYGSGCGAALSIARVSEGAARFHRAIDPGGQLAARRRLNVEEYEEIFRACEESDRNDGERIDPARWGLTGGLHYVGTADHRRRYTK
ncbi:hydroxymethylglutaryl-CoA synthase [Wenzhouxiangella marina]|uniref:Putative hydroxymethylglutaryl-CoA synthase n=1 Tax=Wenzhouxiangella marina TaxID=1579979 RepID=A0A0K0XZC1_9GAMM|nr:hydroxymethylglutaryl-CoA synthase [Wenzhouxiangella marina]AKS43020.1 Putative hydroxymethylglutaryl-CoA synthase [Wenzhouxiangella marina]MBB6087297.1 hydroxymethylglutaryl-CoA synthase [Wenzhouxiangella marina]